MTTTTHSPAPARRLLAALPRRWPSVAAVATFLTVGASGAAEGLAPALMLLPTAYLLALAAGRRWTWPLVLAIMSAYVGLRALELDPRTMLLAVAGTALGAAVLHHRDRREILVQGAGLAGFGGIAVAAAVVAPPVAPWLIAAAWFAHGVWDLVHLGRDAVVSRSFAEWCGIIDVLTAAAIVATTTSLLP